jgi:hypothetical protein
MSCSRRRTEGIGRLSSNMLSSTTALKEELQRLRHGRAGGQPARPYCREGRMSRLDHLDSLDIFSAIGTGQCENLPSVPIIFTQVSSADLCVCDTDQRSLEPMDNFHGSVNCHRCINSSKTSRMCIHISLDRSGSQRFHRKTLQKFGGRLGQMVVGHQISESITNLRGPSQLGRYDSADDDEDLLTLVQLRFVQFLVQFVPIQRAWNFNACS